MKSEAQTIAFISRSKLTHLSSEDLSAVLFKEGYSNGNNEPFSTTQIGSLLHSVNQAKRKAARTYLEQCGIDREANPCGDASDY